MDQTILDEPTPVPDSPVGWPAVAPTLRIGLLGLWAASVRPSPGSVHHRGSTWAAAMSSCGSLRHSSVTPAAGGLASRRMQW